MPSDVNNQDDRDKEMCAIALDEAFGLCGNNAVIFEQIATIMGIPKNDLTSVTPLDTKYKGILAGGPRQGNKWVIARAWDLVVNEQFGIMDAFHQAWEEAEPQPLMPTSGSPASANQGGVASQGYPVDEDSLDIDDFPEQ